MQDKIIWVIGGVTLVVMLLVGVLIFKAPKPNQAQTIDTTLLDLTSEDHIYGKTDAPVVLLEYSDFQCPACGAYYPLVKQILADYPDKVKLVFRHFPLSQHKNARIAARAAEAANSQDKFWEMYNLLFEKQSEWSDLSDPKQQFKQYAIDIELDVDQFMKDLDTTSFDTKVQNDVVSGNKVGITGTPTFFINGEKIPNPKSYEDFKSIIDAY